MKHFKVIFQPDGKQVSARPEDTLLQAASQAGIILNTVCGGKGICKKCAVNLEPDGRQVLACQYRVEHDLTVTVPAASRFFEQRILTEGITGRRQILPDVYKKYRKSDSTAAVFGVAIDIGTTTVVAKLIDMAAGQCLATQATLNPQSRFGDDVISRISCAQTDEKLVQLHTVIMDCINQLIDRLCSQASTDANHIYEVCVVGNTTMNHLFLKLPVVQLGQAPYRAFSLDAHDVPAERFGLRMNPSGNIHTVENIAGFVGSDTTAGVLAVDIDSAQDVTLLVDIGTNGELVLNTNGHLYAASCAAGPAFEGARISCGSRAVEGAIEGVVLSEGDIDLTVIGNDAARSICGSGLVDAVAVLLDLGIVDATGRFVEPRTLKGKLPPAIAARIIERCGQPGFCLTTAANEGITAANVSDRPIVLMQKDIRELQLAKAAIRAGVKILLKKTGIKDADIKQVLLAGAFGNYIRPQSAVRIGLLPDVLVERIHFVGNAAVAGAEMILISRLCRARAGESARKIEYVEIAHEPDFQTVFADCMSFDI
jgi:uncharacterized 2Fe-2S/4Fe-4S cluster protein (DUF4445 family)